MEEKDRRKRYKKKDRKRQRYRYWLNVGIVGEVESDE